MGALPKNKITKTERGKRRRGNTPLLKKNVGQAKVAKHKQGLVSQIFSKIGISLANESKK